MRTINRLISIALLAATVFTACDGEGPMGPPGEPGPDGTNGGGGSGGGAMTYITPAGSEIRWEGLDGWEGYGVGMLNVNGHGWVNWGADNGLPLAEEAVAAFNQGGLLLVYADFGAGWRSLPILDRPLENSLFAIYLNYELEDGRLLIWNRVRDEEYADFEQTYAVQRLKVVVAPATENGTLELPGF